MNSKRPAFLDETADTVPSTSNRLIVQVYLGPRSYEIDIVTDGLASLSGRLENCRERLSAPGGQVSRKALIVTDTTVAKLYAHVVRRSLEDDGWVCQTHEVEPGEQSKCLASASAIYDRLVEFQADRHTIIAAVGGGVVGDLAGFAAATYARGIPFIQIPTTLLAQVDSSVGGKVGINHPRGKNLIGAFHQPTGVFIDTATLDSLPDRDYVSGLGEVIKYGVSLDEQFFEYLESNVEGICGRAPDVLRYVIAHSCRLKADIVEADEEERNGQRAILNYGHTFAHAFETLCGYGTLLHGEAVSIGMVCAARLAERRRLIDSSLTLRQSNLLEAVGLPTKLPAAVNLSATDIIERMRLDKKTVAGQLRFVLPTKLGHAEVFADVPEEDVIAVLDESAG
jgi:3-dehydroquinate synthase